VLGYVLGGLGSVPGRAQMFLFFMASRSSLGSTQRPLQDSSVGIVTGYGLDGQNLVPLICKIFATPWWQDSGAYPVSCPMGSGTLSPGIKQQESEADRSPPPNAKISYGGTIPPLPHTFMA
jgi:hypothetical protein